MLQIKYLIIGHFGAKEVSVLVEQVIHLLLLQKKIGDFSPSSNAEFYYLNNQSTNYEYKANSKSKHNYRIGYGFDITSISGWSIVTNFERFGASGKGYVNELYLLLGYVPIDDTILKFNLKIKNTEN